MRSGSPQSRGTAPAAPALPKAACPTRSSWREAPPGRCKGTQNDGQKKGALHIIVWRAPERRRRPTLPHCGAVPSARPGLTSLFGMGRGGTPGLKPPDYVVALATGQTACRLTCGNRRDSSRHGSLRASSAATACASRAKLTGY